MKRKLRVDDSPIRVVAMVATLMGVYRLSGGSSPGFALLAIGAAAAGVARRRGRR